MVNKVILVGNVGAEPEIKLLQNDLKLAKFRMATNEHFGSDNRHTEWHSIVVWRNLADFVEKYVKKGSMLYVEGRIRRREYTDKEGNKRYSFEIFADTIRLLSKIGSEDSSFEKKTKTEPTADDFISGDEDTSNFDTDIADEEDDDLPF